MSSKDGRGFFESDKVVVGSVPKNNATEFFVSFKKVMAGTATVPTAYFDIRENWYKDGADGEPLPTAKGVLIRREYVGRLIKLLLNGLDDGEINEDLSELLARKTARQ